ncbi:MAG: lipoprotein signal peptidase [Prevotella sp.]|nr:lipoprotein signal peptidase [Prevotella sp.]
MLTDNHVRQNGWLAIIIVGAILFIDQAIKLYVKTDMALHESRQVTSWFYISFIENNGMAYGMQLMPKYMLTLFRVVAIAFIGGYLYRQICRGIKVGYLVCLSMVIAGAAGNLIDCLFYGLCFEESTPWHVAAFTDFGQGYAPFMMGRVVDMFYFPLIVTTYPEWIPIWGGEPFVFFSPVFNFADACISVGVVALLLFYRAEISKIEIGKREKKSDGQE